MIKFIKFLILKKAITISFDNDLNYFLMEKVMNKLSFFLENSLLLINKLNKNNTGDNFFFFNKAIFFINLINYK